MKKFLFVGTLALAVATVLELEAWAWISTNFSVGLNYCYQSGGNNLLWGVFRNGQPGCCCDLPNAPARFYAIQHGYDPFCPCPGGYGPGPDYGHDFVPPPPMPALPAPTPLPGPQANWYGQPAFQAVNYTPFSGNYYTPANWYGR
jgi:hypothetical protein